jgi:hypothetical protein
MILDFTETGTVKEGMHTKIEVGKTNDMQKISLRIIFVKKEKKVK